MDKNTSIGAIAGVGIVLVIAFVFALFPAESDDTIILVNKNGNDPVNSCAPGNGLILAQNLTDLCDVVIVSPVSEEVLKYNGTFWTNQNETISGVTSITSNSNSTIGVVPTTGDVVLYPKYELLCQSTLTSNQTSLSCSSFSPRRIMIITVISNITGGTGVEPGIRFNGDTGGNYAFRGSANGGADFTTTSTNRCNIIGAGGTLSASGEFSIFYGDIINNSNYRKLMSGLRVTGADLSITTAPTRGEMVCKWNDTTSQITTITLFRVTGTGSFGINTQISVWGYN